MLLVSAETLVAAVFVVDAADEAMFLSSFNAFEEDFGFSPMRLGILAMCQQLSKAVSGHVWAALLPYFGCRDLLLSACFFWSITTAVTP
ncbi:unnamed protein product, partial [Amoebophrya sp. A25]|eukprot:GSA25T00002107001.1